MTSVGSGEPQKPSEQEKGEAPAGPGKMAPAWRMGQRWMETKARAFWEGVWC